MIRRTVWAAAAFSFLCFAWICSVPLYYVVTRDGEAIVQLTRSVLISGEPWVPRFAVGLAFLFVQFIAVPYGLLLALYAVWARLGSPVWQGTLAGLCYGLWADAVFLAVPYLGGYPSFPGFGLATLLGCHTDAQEPLPLLVCNVVLATAVGILLAIQRARRLGRST